MNAHASPSNGRVLFSAFIGSDNLGDELVFSSLAGRLRREHGLDVSAFSLRTDRDYGVPGLRLVHTWNPFRILKELRRTDLLVIGGGGLIQDTSSAYNVLRHLWIAILALFVGTPYVIVAVGVSPIRWSWNRALVRFVANRARGLSVRDEGSRDELEGLGVTTNVVVAGDPVMAWLAVSPSASAPERPFVAVCLRHWFEQQSFVPVSVVRRLGLRSRRSAEAYERFVSRMAEFLDRVVEETNLDVCFASFFAGRDEVVHRDVASRMRHGDRVSYGPAEFSMTATDDIIARSRFVIGMRFHALVLASRHAVPCLALSYTEKVSRLCGILGTSRFCHNVDELDVGRLVASFEEMVRERDVLAERIRSGVDAIVERERMNLEEIVAVLAGRPRVVTAGESSATRPNTWMSPRLKHWTLIGSAVCLAIGIVLALRGQPDLHSNLRWGPLAALALIGVPANVLLNSAGIVLAGRVAGARLGWRSALEVSVVSTAANLLPLPGGPITRVAALKNAGGSVRSAAWATFLIGGVWTGVCLVYAGVCTSLVAGNWFGVPFVLTGAVVLLATTMRLQRTNGAGMAALILATQSLHVVNASFRLWLCLLACGWTATIAQAASLTVSTVVGSIVGIVPAGLGVREGAAALIAPVVGIPASLGFLSAALNRLVGLAATAPLAVALSTRSRPESIEVRSSLS